MDITESRNIIQVEEARYRSSLSESLFRRVGAALNFIMKNHIEYRGLYINGFYGNATVPFNDIDGGIIFEKPVEIVNVYIKCRLKGTSGTTELDLKWKPQASGSWASIFSTTPKFTTTATDHQACGIGDSITGFTAPVLSKTTFAAKDMLRLDLIQAMAAANGCSIILHIRPV